MYLPNDDFRQGSPLYDIPEEEYSDYSAGQETGAGKQNIYIDKSQHITNYNVSINVTGDNVANFETGVSGALPTYILESELSNKLVVVLDEIEDLLEAPAAFEQKLSIFLSMLDTLYERRMEREVYFSDLLSILRMALVNIECGELYRSGITALKEVVSSLAHKITEQKVRELRIALREGGIDILKPLKSNVDTRTVLREIYGDETTA